MNCTIWQFCSWLFGGVLVVIAGFKVGGAIHQAVKEWVMTLAQEAVLDHWRKAHLLPMRTPFDYNPEDMKGEVTLLRERREKEDAKAFSKLTATEVRMRNRERRGK